MGMKEEPRVSVTFRCGLKGRNWLRKIDDQVAPDGGVSDVIRAALMVARHHEKELITILRGNQIK